ncbi:hypothetical protein N7492_006212 [Penicillium capsulatum]|uniref:Uncharacterized protein n=1 Tax=Penicillium capsulatum TaxID=69766 RepID=A0A9W9I2H3_9EURO|nr:hypothetical protein N7492_006212 [Penicillium capsulatum]KAJ6108865.1 hypothetical protein N7512_008702 [Penicillium capsulatum]
MGIAVLRAIQRQVKWNSDHKGRTTAYHDALTKLYNESPTLGNLGLFELFFNEFVYGLEPSNTPGQNTMALNAFIASQKAWETS